MPPFANSVSLQIDKNAYGRYGYSIPSGETLEYDGILISHFYLMNF